MRVRRHFSAASPLGTGLRPAGVAVRKPSGLGLYVGTAVVTFLIGYAIAALVLFPAPIFAASKSVPRVLGMALEDARQWSIFTAGQTDQSFRMRRQLFRSGGTLARLRVLRHTQLH